MSGECRRGNSSRAEEDVQVSKAYLSCIHTSVGVSTSFDAFEVVQRYVYIISWNVVGSASKGQRGATHIVVSTVSSKCPISDKRVACDTSGKRPRAEPRGRQPQAAGGQPNPGLQLTTSLQSHAAVST